MLDARAAFSLKIGLVKAAMEGGDPLAARVWTGRRMDRRRRDRRSRPAGPGATAAHGSPPAAPAADEGEEREPEQEKQEEGPEAGEAAGDDHGGARGHGVRGQAGLVADRPATSTRRPRNRIVKNPLRRMVGMSPFCEPGGPRAAA